MNYTNVQKQQIRANLQKIVDYIEAQILPHITYSYETGTFGPMEMWGMVDENSGRRYKIALNGPYKDKIRFYHADVPYNADELVENNADYAVEFLKYWQDAKSYMNTEIKSKEENMRVIETFQI